MVEATDLLPTLSGEEKDEGKEAVENQTVCLAGQMMFTLLRLVAEFCTIDVAQSYLSVDCLIILLARSLRHKAYAMRN